jgi:CubicO group peptidase (beta-lactamase class C family)
MQSFKSIYTLQFFISLFFLFGWLNSGCQSNGNAHSVKTFHKENKDSINAARIFIQINGPEKNRKLDSFFQFKIHQQGFNGAMLVAQWGQILYKNCYGWADVNNREGINEHTAFQLASVSKQFTAVCILQLMEKGLLSLDDEVQNYFPGFPYPNVTIKLLLSHRSGLPNYLNFAPLYWKNKTQLMSNSDLIQMMINNKPRMASRPDSHFEYCNTNYAVLAAIVEKISGMSFANYADQNLFKRIGMNDSWIFTQENYGKCTSKACGYSRSNWIKGGIDFTDGVTGDKGVYCSINDMWKWDCAMYDYTLLKKETLDEAYQPRSFEKKGVKNYGYGWRMFVYSPTLKAVYHNGWWHQFNNAYFRGLNDRTTVIVLGSNSNFANYQIQPILDIVSGTKSSTKNSMVDDEDK